MFNSKNSLHNVLIASCSVIYSIPVLIAFCCSSIVALQLSFNLFSFAISLKRCLRWISLPTCACTQIYVLVYLLLSYIFNCFSKGLLLLFIHEFISFNHGFVTFVQPFQLCNLSQKVHFFGGFHDRLTQTNLSLQFIQYATPRHKKREKNGLENCQSPERFDFPDHFGVT